MSRSFKKVPCWRRHRSGFRKFDKKEAIRHTRQAPFDEDLEGMRYKRVSSKDPWSDYSDYWRKIGSFQSLREYAEIGQWQRYGWSGRWWGEEEKALYLQHNRKRIEQWLVKYRCK